jgi:hypothetical protein
MNALRDGNSSLTSIASMKRFSTVGVLAALCFVGRVDPDERLKLLEPTGPYGVGQRVFRWTDTARSEPMSGKPGANRQVVITLLYPALKEQRGRAADYFLDLSAVRKVLNGPGPKLWALVTGTAQDHAPPAPGAKQVPLVLFSPGNDMNAAQYSTITHELVSHGYAVAAIDHPYDSRGVVLSDGTVAKFAESLWPRGGSGNPSGHPAETPHWKFYRDRVRVRVADALFGLARLIDFSRQEPVFAELINFENTGFAGHSIGGVAAGEVCRSHGRFRACLNLDGSTFDGPFFSDEGPARPDAAYMMITKPFEPSDEKLRQFGLARDQWLAKYKDRQATYFRKMGAGSYKATVDLATHSSFSDDALLIAIGTKSGGVEQHRSITERIRFHAVDFFDTHLRRSRSSVRTEGMPGPPGVTVERW